MKKFVVCNYCKELTARELKSRLIGIESDDYKLWSIALDDFDPTTIEEFETLEDARACKMINACYHDFWNCHIHFFDIEVSTIDIFTRNSVDDDWDYIESEQAGHFTDEEIASLREKL